MAKKKIKPLGRPLPPATDQEAEVTPEDVEQAKMWVEKYGSDRLNAMLNAKVEDEGDFS